MKKEQLVPQPLPSLKDENPVMNKENVKKYLEQMGETIEDNNDRRNRARHRTVLCGVINGMMKALTGDTRRTRSHFSWCVCQEWDKYDERNEFRESISYGAELIRQQRAEQ